MKSTSTLPSFSVALVAAAACTTAMPHSDWRRWWCHAYRCDVSLCLDTPQAPPTDQLQVAANQYLYDSLGSDCGSITNVPTTVPILQPSDVPPNPRVFCPNGQGLWLSTFTFEIWRSKDHYAAGDHVKNWNGTRFPGSTMFYANCAMDNGMVYCERGDTTCKDKYAPRPGEKITPRQVEGSI